MTDKSLTKDEECTSDDDIPEDSFDTQNIPNSSLISPSFTRRYFECFHNPSSFDARRFSRYYNSPSFDPSWTFSTPPQEPPIIRSDPFADRLIEEGIIVEPWKHTMYTSLGFCRLKLPIIGLERKILTHLLEGRCPKKDDEEFSYLKACDIKDYFKLRTKYFHEIIIESFDDFYKQFMKIACSEWSKFTRDGESFGGPHKAPDGSEEKINAYQICQKDNAKALWDSGYNPLALLYCVNFLCGYRCEGVAEVRDLCKWVCDLPKEKEEK